MKTKLASVVLALAVFTAPFALTTSCTQSQFNDSAIIAAVTVATTTGLKMAVQDPARRTVIADYLEVYSVALRSVTGNPTPEQLTTLINQFIPQNVKDQYPELVTFAIPLIVGAYKQAYDKWGSAQAVKYLNDIATGIEDGAAPYITHRTALNRIRTDSVTRYEKPVAFCWTCSCWTAETQLGNGDEFKNYLTLVASTF